MQHRYLLLITILLSATLCSTAQSWKTYPYHQTGSVLNFPADEGYHPGQIVEWWYTNAHITGDSTGTDYSYMLTYFYYPTFGFDGFRILELSNETTGAFTQETQPCHYPTLAQDHLHIMANTGITGTGHEEWNTLSDTAGHLIPYQYHINAAGANGSLNVTYNSVKRPLMVGGTGFLYEGITGYTYYYSETTVEVTGSISMNGVTEPVHGIAWIDRQWGQFDPNNGEKYTWMSLQLSNGMDMNLWNIFNTKNQIPDTSTYRFCSIYINDSTDNTISNFTLERLKYIYTSDNVQCYDQQWRLSYGNVDLILTATHSNDEVTLPFRFFEGSLTITGTVGGNPVTGVGYVELLHSFSKPQLSIANPVGHQAWDGSTPITWRLLNPDDGRPVYYDVEISTDNKSTYTKIAHALTDTLFNWTPSLSNGTEGWFRITGYSIDSTLSGFVVSDTSFIMDPTGISEIQTSGITITNHPNPFEGQTTLTYELKQAGQLKIDIINTSGAVVKNLYAGFATTGKHDFEWNGTNNEGAEISTGLYFYRLQMGADFVYGKALKIK